MSVLDIAQQVIIGIYTLGFLMIPEGYESQIIRGLDSTLNRKDKQVITSQQNTHEESNLRYG